MAERFDNAPVPEQQEGAELVRSLNRRFRQLVAMLVGIRRDGKAFVLEDSFLELKEQTADPAAPGANRVRLYAKDNGAGKTVVYALYNTGAAQQVSIQP